jgi:uncharacterized protein YoxC
MNHETLELTFVGVAALALLMQTLILLAIFLGIRKAASSVKEDVEEMKSSVMPMVEKTQDLLARMIVLAPKVESAVTDASDLARILRTQAQEVQSSMQDALVRVRAQSSRIDEMFTGTLDAVDKAGEFVTRAVSKPMRQMSGVLASIRAFVETMQAPDPAANTSSSYEHEYEHEIADNRSSKDIVL